MTRYRYWRRQPWNIANGGRPTAPGSFLLTSSLATRAPDDTLLRTIVNLDISIEAHGATPPPIDLSTTLLFSLTVGFSQDNSTGVIGDNDTSGKLLGAWFLKPVNNWWSTDLSTFGTLWQPEKPLESEAERKGDNSGLGPWVVCGLNITDDADVLDPIFGYSFFFRSRGVLSTLWSSTTPP